jgi:hypothetical protein
MTQTVSPSHNILEESEQLIADLQQHPTASAQVQDMLKHHMALREELKHRQEQSEQSLAAWRAALQRRWHCEIAGQRVYTRIVQQLRNFFGPDSPQLQVIGPHPAEFVGSAADLLNDMWRLHATLLILQPDLPCEAETIAQFELACQNLDAALSDTAYYEEQRRRTSVEFHMAQNACKCAMDEMTSLLAEQADIPDSIYATVYTNGQTYEKFAESRYVEV